MAKLPNPSDYHIIPASGLLAVVRTTMPERSSENVQNVIAIAAPLDGDDPYYLLDDGYNWCNGETQPYCVNLVVQSSLAIPRIQTYLRHLADDGRDMTGLIGWLQDHIQQPDQDEQL